MDLAVKIVLKFYYCILYLNYIGGEKYDDFENVLHRNYGHLYSGNNCFFVL